MRWRNLLVSGGAALGGVAAYNFFQRRSIAPLPNLLGGEEGTFEWRGRQLAWTMHGEGPPLLLVHSIGLWSWSYEWRRSIDVLSQHHTVYTLDLLGFGRSERPPVHYAARLYVAMIADFARRVIGAPTALVAAGLSATYAVELAAADPASYPVLVLVAPPGLTRLRTRTSTGDDMGRQLVAAPVLGTAAWNARVTRAALARSFESAYYRDDRITDEMLDVAFATTHQPGAKYAPAAWLAHRLNLDVRQALRRLLPPTLLVWGAQAERHPAEESFGWRAVRRGLKVAILDGAGDVPHEERAAEFNEIAVEFLQRA